MRIEPCGGKAEPKKLSYEVILQSEGIYRYVDSDKGYVVVLKCAGEVVSFFVNGYGQAEPCMGIKKGQFFRVDGAKLCLEIRE